MSSSSAQIKTGAVLSYLSLLLTNVAGIFVTPYMLRSLGKSEYGLYMLIGAFLGYLTVFDFGLANSIVRYVARYQARNDKEGEQNFLALAMITYVGISLLALLAGIIAYSNLDLVFGSSLSLAEMSLAQMMSAILLFNLVLALPAGAFDAVLMGHQRFSFAKSIELIRFVIRTTALIALLYFGYKALAIVILDTAVNVFFSLWKSLYVLFRLRVRFVLHRFDKALMYEVFSYSFWIACALILYQLYLRVGQIALGIMDGTSAVAVFSVSIVIVGYYGSFGHVISSLLLPHSIRVVEQGASSNELTDLMIRVGRIQFLIASYVMAGFILFGYPFIQLWAGADYGSSWLIAIIIMLPSTLMMVRSVGENILLAMNRFVFRAFYFLVMVVCALAFGLVARSWVDGPLAMGIGMMIASLVTSTLAHFYYIRVMNIDMIRFYREVLLVQSVCLTAACMCGGVMVHFFPVTGWRSLASEAALFSCLFGALMWFCGTNAYEKQLVRDALSVARKWGHA